METARLLTEGTCFYFIKTGKGAFTKDVRLTRGRGGLEKKTQKNRTPIVIFIEILLLIPDRRGRGSENDDFGRTSFVNAP